MATDRLVQTVILVASILHHFLNQKQVIKARAGKS